MLGMQIRQRIYGIVGLLTQAFVGLSIIACCFSNASIHLSSNDCESVDMF